MKAETMVKMLLLTMPNELVPSVIMTLSNVVVQVATGKLANDDIPHDKWELALLVIQAIARNEVMEKLSKVEATEAISKAKQS